MIEALKRWMLQAKMPKKKALVASGVNEFKTIGILYDATSEKHRSMVTKWSKKWANKSVTSCGFYNNKLPFENKELPTYHLKELNWYDLPTSPAIDAFLKKEYDLLVIATNQVYPHMQYIIANAKYKLGAGPSNPSTMPFLSLIVEGSQLDNPEKIITNIVEAINKIAK